MTDSANHLPQYWYIRVSAAKAPQSKFHFFEQVGIPGENDRGESYYDIGVIIGMQYGARGCSQEEWYYLVRYLKYDSNRSWVGTDDGNFIEESALVADDTVIEKED